MTGRANVQRSFSGGEIAPAVHARTEQVKRATGCERIRNAWVTRHGIITNRPGTGWAGEIKDSTRKARLYRWVFNADQTYVLELGHLTMRVIRAGGYVTESAKTVTNVTQASVGVVTSVAHGFLNGDHVALAVIGGMTQLNGRTVKVANKTNDTFEIQDLDGTPINTTSYGAYTSGGTASRIYTLATPYTEDQVFDLDFAQLNDVVRVTHAAHPPKDLKRTAHDNWTIANTGFAPTLQPPTGLANTGAAGSTYEWVLTSVDTETPEESLQSSATSSSTNPATTPVTITWVAASGATEYNVFRKLNGVYGFIGVAQGTAFQDTGVAPDTTHTPPASRNPFSVAGDYPSCVAYDQQRLIYAGSDNKPDKGFMSRAGNYLNFTKSAPSQPADAIDFRVPGRDAHRLKFLVVLERLLALTTSGIFTVDGGADGVYRPGEINPRQHSYFGCGALKPQVVGRSAVYLQAGSTIIRDLFYRFEQDGYQGSDLTVYATHLFEGYTVKDWAYQEVPNSILWVVRSDGKLLALTYIPEHELWAWTRHDTDGGTVESVACVPEKDAAGIEETALYMLVKRGTRRYVERMKTRRIADIVDAVFVDSSLTYDGRHTGATTMTLSGSGWTYTDTLTLTASVASFASADVGKAVHLTGADGTILRCEIAAFTSTTVVSVKPNKTVPTSMRNVTIGNGSGKWALAVKKVTGLWHLEGKKVSVLGDGFVAANPNNDAYAVLTVTNGEITLDRHYAVIHAGLPITADVQTLDADVLEGETLIGKKKLYTKLVLQVEGARGLWAGRELPAADNSLAGLREFKLRKDETYDEPPDLTTGAIELNIRGNWNKQGRITIRQTDPLPMTLLAMAPSGLIPFRR